MSINLSKGSNREVIFGVIAYTNIKFDPESVFKIKEISYQNLDIKIILENGKNWPYKDAIPCNNCQERIQDGGMVSGCYIHILLGPNWNYN